MSRVAPIHRLLLTGLGLLAACSSAPPTPRSATRETESQLPDSDAEHGLPAGFSWEYLADSRQGRPIETLQLGDGPRRVYWIGGIHGDEREGLAQLGAVLGEVEVPDGVTLRVLRDLNPDGSAARRRGNAKGVDLNRNWPARNFQPGRRHGARPLSEPETSAVHDDLLAFDPDLVVVFHSSHRGPYVNYDGPAREAAEAFVRGANAASPHRPWRILEDMGYPTPGSLGSWAGLDQEIPILTIEFRRGEPSRPGTIARALSLLLAVAQAD